MTQFDHVADIVTPLTNITEIVRDLRSKGLEVGENFNFKYVAVTEYDDYNVPRYDHIRFAFKESKWVTYVILKYG